MKSSPAFLSLLLCGVSLLAGCESARLEKKADVYRQSGAAPSMLEAQRMAENYYWPESVHIREEQQRREAAARAAKP